MNPTPEFDSAEHDENPDRIVGRVFRKLNMLSNTLEQIEAWLEFPPEGAEAAPAGSRNSFLREWMERDGVQVDVLPRGGTTAENFVG